MESEPLSADKRWWDLPLEVSVIRPKKLIAGSGNDLVRTTQIDRTRPSDETQHLQLVQSGLKKPPSKSAKQTRELLASIVESCGDPIASADLHGTIRSWNRPCERLHGISAAEALGRNLYDVLTSCPQNEIKQILETVRSGCSVEPFEYVVRHPDGSHTDVSTRVSPVLNQQGEVIGASAIFRDITEQKRTEENLRDSLDALENAQKIGNLGCYALDIRTALWTSSSVMDEIFGIGQSPAHTLDEWRSLVHPEERPVLTAYFRDEVIGRCIDFDKEYRIIRPSDGAERWVHGIGKLEFDTGGNPIKMSGVIRDVTESKAAIEAIRRSHEHYRALFQTSIDAIILSRLTDGVIFDVNQAFLEMTGFAREEVIGRPSLSFNLWAVPAQREQLTSLLRHYGKVRDFRAKFRRKNGKIFPGSVSISAVEIDGISFATALLRDDSDTEAAAQKLSTATEASRLSEARYRTAFQTSLDAIAINRIDNGQYIDCNQALLDVLGFTREEMLGRTSLELGIWMHALDRARLIHYLEHHDACRDFETQFNRKNGETFWGRMSASKIDVDGIPCILTASRDIDAEKRAAEEIRKLAYYDHLTQVPNRQSLQENLQQSLQAAQRAGGSKGAMLLIDLDDFKTLNDSLGHQAGDFLLQQVAARLTGCSVGFVARLGGDEFVVILDHLGATTDETMERAGAEAQKILVAIAQPYIVAGRRCVITCSIGITAFGDRQDSLESVMQQADIAMYQSKAAGRNAVCAFAPALKLAVSARASMEEALRQAIATNQFELYYQPQIDRDSVVGAEALLRWNRPNHDVLCPGAFIPLAEETGLILPLGEWIMEAAFSQVAAWATRKETEHLSLSVNISARQFRQPEFVRQVLSALQRTGAHPERIKLELTESVTVDDIEGVVEKIAILRSHGLSFSLDDFGTGYSSLSYLRKLPLDQLKIDRSFVQDMLLDAGSGAIAQTIMSLSQALGLSVIAEGVETEEQRTFLLRLGCHAFQGYLFSVPLPLKDFEKWLIAFPQRNSQQQSLA